MRLVESGSSASVASRIFGRSASRSIAVTHSNPVGDNEARWGLLRRPQVSFFFRRTYRCRLPGSGGRSGMPKSHRMGDEAVYANPCCQRACRASGSDASPSSMGATAVALRRAVIIPRRVRPMCRRLRIMLFSGRRGVKRDAHHIVSASGKEMCDKRWREHRRRRGVRQMREARLSRRIAGVLAFLSTCGWITSAVAATACLDLMGVGIPPVAFSLPTTGASITAADDIPATSPGQRRSVSIAE